MYIPNQNLIHNTHLQLYKIYITTSWTNGSGNRTLFRIVFVFVLYLFFQYCICVRLILNSNSWLRNVNCLPKSTVVNLERRAGVKEVSWRFDALKHNLIIDLNLWNNYTESYFHSIRNFDQQSFSFALADACRIYLAWHTTSPSDFTLYWGRILNCAFLALNSLSITLKKTYITLQTLRLITGELQKFSNLQQIILHRNCNKVLVHVY